MRMNMECASPSRVNERVVRFVQHRNVRVLVWSMCEWSGFTTLECASACLVNVRVLVSSMCEWSGVYITEMCE